MMSFKEPRGQILWLYDPPRICPLYGQSCSIQRKRQRVVEGMHAPSFRGGLPLILRLPALRYVTPPSWEKQSVDGQRFAQLILRNKKEEGRSTERQLAGSAHFVNSGIFTQHLLCVLQCSSRMEIQMGREKIKILAPVSSHHGDAWHTQPSELDHL